MNPNQTDPKPNPAPDSPILFEVLVINRNYLRIPYAIAKDYFPASSRCPHTEHTLHLNDPINRFWQNITYLGFKEEQAFILIGNNWANYVEQCNLFPGDRVRFIGTESRPGPKHFRVQHFYRPKSESLPFFPMELAPQIFLFQKELTRVEAESDRLYFESEEVRTNFPGIEVPNGEQKQEMIRFTDCRNNDWFLVIKYSDGLDEYFVREGWYAFVKEHRLRIGDTVMFYKADNVAHKKHFLIHCARKSVVAGGGSNPGQGGGRSKDKGKSIEHPRRC